MELTVKRLLAARREIEKHGPPINAILCGPDAIEKLAAEVPRPWPGNLGSVLTDITLIPYEPMRGSNQFLMFEDTNDAEEFMAACLKYRIGWETLVRAMALIQKPLLR
jgi:hypothetical protein